MKTCMKGNKLGCSAFYDSPMQRVFHEQEVFHKHCVDNLFVGTVPIAYCRCPPGSRWLSDSSVTLTSATWELIISTLDAKNALSSAAWLLPELRMPEELRPIRNC